LLSNTTAANVSALSSFVLNSSISFSLLNALLLIYMTMPILALVLFFRNNEYALFSIVIVEGIIWLIAISVILGWIREFDEKLITLSQEVLKIAG